MKSNQSKSPKAKIRILSVGLLLILSACGKLESAIQLEKALVSTAAPTSNFPALTQDGMIINEPSDGAILPYANIPLTFQVRDADLIVQVQIILDGQVINTDNLSGAGAYFADHPLRVYSCSDGRTLIAPGSHTIEISATDALGNVSTTSAQVQLN